MASVNSVSQMANSAARRQYPSQPAVFSNDAAPIAATHGRPVQYSQNHAYGQEAPTRLPRSFLAEGPRASRALSASRASSSPNSTGSSPAWPSSCRGRPSGRRGRTRRATMRACGLLPARRWGIKRLLMRPAYACISRLATSSSTGIANPRIESICNDHRTMDTTR